jgi:hypothetical protein
MSGEQDNQATSISFFLTFLGFEVLSAVGHNAAYFGESQPKLSERYRLHLQGQRIRGARPSLQTSSPKRLLTFKGIKGDTSQ